ncbi:MAG: 4Fe-4S cluster-binding domain-containing protein [Planctomycetota bacterium]
MNDKQKRIRLAMEKANLHLNGCELCEHRCLANRNAGQCGPCKAGTVARVFRHRVEFSEELELSPSHIFYLSGCDMRCKFCISEENAFDPNRGEVLTGKFLRRAIDQGEARGARNIQWLGGEANVHLPQILAAVAECPRLPPIVWKSNFHMTPAVFDLLDGIVDVYVADFKFGNDACAIQLASTDNYVSIVTRNLRLARHRADLIVRHLVMPGHLDCCTRPVVEWMSSHLPEVKFSLRGGFIPAWNAKNTPGLQGYLSADEYRIASQYAESAQLVLIE